MYEFRRIFQQIYILLLAPIDSIEQSIVRMSGSLKQVKWVFEKFWNTVIFKYVFIMVVWG